jgi:hypothetical protein
VAVTVSRLEAVLTADTRPFDRSMDKSEGRMHKVGRVAGVAGLAIAGGLAVGLEKSVKAAMAAQVSNEQVPAVVDEVVSELYGGWTAKARNHVRSLERQSSDDLGIPPQEARSQEP